MGIKISQIDNSVTKPRLLYSGVSYGRGVTKSGVSTSKLNNNIGTVVGERKNANDCISFKGNIIDSALRSKPAHMVIHRAFKNPLLSEALFALVITCGLRPATIMSTAGKDEENKNKCKMQVAKSFATGLVGLGTTIIVSNPISHAINKFAGSGGKNLSLPAELAEKVETLIKPANQFLKDNAERLSGFVVRNIKGEQLETTIENIVMTKGAKEELQKFSGEIFGKVADAIAAQKGINKYRSTMSSLLKKVICPVFSPSKAAVTIALVPVLLGVIFKKDKDNKQEPKENKPESAAIQPQKTQQLTSKGNLMMLGNTSKLSQVKGGQQ